MRLMPGRGCFMFQGHTAHPFHTKKQDLAGSDLGLTTIPQLIRGNLLLEMCFGIQLASSPKAYGSVVQPSSWLTGPSHTPSGSDKGDLLWRPSNLSLKSVGRAPNRVLAKRPVRTNCHLPNTVL